jgi:magnesium-transporting ATPase (P-type)
MSFPLTTDPQHDYPHIPLPKSSFLRRIWSPEPVSRLPLFIDKIPFYRDPVELAHCLQSSLTNGLTEPEAQTRLKVYGENVLKGKGKPTIWVVLWRQVWNAMTLILVAALIIAVIIDDYSEGGFIAGFVHH